MGTETQGTRAKIELAIDLGSDPIQGRISGAGGASAAFHGWLELMEAIEAVRMRDERTRETSGAGKSSVPTPLSASPRPASLDASEQTEPRRS